MCAHQEVYLSRVILFTQREVKSSERCGTTGYMDLSSLITTWTSKAQYCTAHVLSATQFYLTNSARPIYTSTWQYMRKTIKFSALQGGLVHWDVSHWEFDGLIFRSKALQIFLLLRSERSFKLIKVKLPLGVLVDSPHNKVTDYSCQALRSLHKWLLTDTLWKRAATSLLRTQISNNDILCCTSIAYKYTCCNSSEAEINHTHLEQILTVSW